MLMTTLMSIFLILHGLVHLLYAGQSWRLFELTPGMRWPDGSWLFSQPLGNGATRSLASISLAFVALGFMVGGLGLFLGQDWWRLAAVGAACFSTAIFLLLWNGIFQAVDAQGGVGLLINLMLLGSVLLLKWPA
jgi:hypothetical protein